jgi:fatty acid-binding protein DegV
MVAENGAAGVSTVAIVTDSTACLPPELVQRYGISIAPVNLIVDGRTYRDGVDIRPQDFYPLLRRSRKPDRKSTRLNSSHNSESRMPSSA